MRSQWVISETIQIKPPEKDNANRADSTEKCRQPEEFKPRSAFWGDAFTLTDC